MRFKSNIEQNVPNSNAIRAAVIGNSGTVGVGEGSVDVEGVAVGVVVMVPVTSEITAYLSGLDSAVNL